MAVTKAQKESLVKKFRRNELDTGSSEVQIAILTARINDLTPHFAANKKDHHGRRGLVTIVNSRRKLLDYLKRTDTPRYAKIINELGIRK